VILDEPTAQLDPGRDAPGRRRAQAARRRRNLAPHRRAQDRPPRRRLLSDRRDRRRPDRARRAGRRGPGRPAPRGARGPAAVAGEACSARSTRPASTPRTAAARQRRWWRSHDRRRGPRPRLSGRDPRGRRRLAADRGR
jgi:hypothetical protein